MARPDTKRLLLILLATAARALLPPRHRISMRRAPPCQPKRRRTKAPNAAARTAPTRQTTALSASKDETVGKQGAVIVDAEAEFVDGAAGPAAAAAPRLKAKLSGAARPTRLERWFSVTNAVASTQKHAS